MNTRALRVLAAVLAIGAVLMGYWGYRLNQQQLGAAKRADAAAHDAQSVGVAQAVFAVHSLAPGHVIVAGDVKLVPVPVQVEGSLTSLADAMGKALAIPVASGEMLAARHFVAASPLARAVSAGERAVAIRVDEVIAGGGFVQSGDYVDVLLYLRGGNAEVHATSAQVVLRHVRVLAFGDTVGAKSSVVPGVAPKQETGVVKTRAAVLAVPAALTARLMLAASAGDLRLAVYGEQEGQAFENARGVQGTRDLITLPEIAPGAPATPQRAASVRTGGGVTIYRGASKDIGQ